MSIIYIVSIYTILVCTYDRGVRERQQRWEEGRGREGDGEVREEGDRSEERGKVGGTGGGRKDRGRGKREEGKEGGMGGGKGKERERARGKGERGDGRVVNLTRPFSLCNEHYPAKTFIYV